MQKFLTEFLPLIVFFAAYKYYGLITATGILVSATICSTLYIYLSQKRVPGMLLFTTALVSFFGILTVITADDLFIKMKPTIINLLFTALLWGGLLFKRGLLEYAMGEQFTLPHHVWRVLSFRFGILFLGLAVLNEAIWRTQTTDFWVYFKVFGMLPITLIFTATQVPLILRHHENQDTINK